MPPSTDSSKPGTTKLQPKSLAAIAYHPLSGRQGEVLKWVAVGKRDSEVAIILGLSPRTVNKHVHDILVRLTVETRTAAAAWWHERTRLLEETLRQTPP